MYQKIWFGFIAFYFIYQLIRFYKEKDVNLRTTEMAICLLLVIPSLKEWPLYLNGHLCFGLLSFLYGIGMFNEWLRQRKKKEQRDFYFFTAMLLVLLSGHQLATYFS